MDSKQQDIYLALYQYGTQPASAIARLCQTERVYTYKVLQWFVAQWLASQTIKAGVKHFLIPSIDCIAHYITKHQDQWQKLQNQFTYVKTQIDQLSKIQTSQTPKLTLFDGDVNISLLFQDIVQELQANNLLSLTFFGTNTFQEQLWSSKTVNYYIKPLLDYITQHRIIVDTTIAEWALVLEHLQSYNDIHALVNLPAWDNAVNIRVVGQIVYIVIYKQHPIWIKLHSPEFAWSLHFLISKSK